MRGRRRRVSTGDAISDDGAWLGLRDLGSTGAAASTIGRRSDPRLVARPRGPRPWAGGRGTRPARRRPVARRRWTGRTSSPLQLEVGRSGVWGRAGRVRRGRCGHDDDGTGGMLDTASADSSGPRPARGSPARPRTRSDAFAAASRTWLASPRTATGPTSRSRTLVPCVVDDLVEEPVRVASQADAPVVHAWNRSDPTPAPGSGRRAAPGQRPAGHRNAARDDSVPSMPTTIVRRSVSTSPSCFAIAFGVGRGEGAAGTVLRRLGSELRASSSISSSGTAASPAPGLVEDAVDEREDLGDALVGAHGLVSV